MSSILTKTSIKDTLIASSIISIATFFMFATFEPNIIRAAADQFTISVGVTSEISFSTSASNITLSSIPGITGGTSTGGTQVVVTTNNAAGYYMTLKASSSPALQGESQGGSVPDYTTATTTSGVPDYTWSVPVNTAEFGYTVSASTTSDLDQSFLDNGSDTCNTGSADTSGSASCWLNASTTDETIINRNSGTAASGATTTIFFRLQIQSSPSPALPQDTYTATTTLTATTN